MTARHLFLFFVVLLLVGFYFGPKVSGALNRPASEEDPLVTKKWVDSYVFEQFATIRNRTQALESKIQALNLTAEQINNQIRPIIILSVGSKTGLVGNEEKTMEVAPRLVSGRILLPLRFVGEAFGVNFVWDKQAKTVTYRSGSGEVVLPVGKKTALINGRQVSLDVPGMVVGGRTLVPLRFIGESLGAKVIWHPDTKSAEIR